MQQPDETLDRVVRLLARAHDLLSAPLVQPVAADISRPVAADLVEDAYLLAVTAQALAKQRRDIDRIEEQAQIDSWTASVHPDSPVML